MVMLIEETEVAMHNLASALSIESTSFVDVQELMIILLNDMRLCKKDVCPVE